VKTYRLETKTPGRGFCPAFFAAGNGNVAQNKTQKTGHIAQK